MQAEPDGAGKESSARHEVRPNLPAPIDSFVGRGLEMAEVAGLLQSARLVTLTGEPGVGKSRLALEVARSQVASYPDDAFLVDLGAVSDQSLLPQALVSVLSIPERPGQSLTDSLVGYLQDRQLLLILDNCEHLIQACALLTDTLLRACPNLSVLATSRHVLGITGGKVWRVPPLPVPPEAAHFDPEALVSFESVQLFLDRAADFAIDFSVKDAGPAVAEICRRLDGIPLAIELAVARLGGLSVAEVVQQLRDDSLRLLARSTPSGPPRHRSMRAAIEWSYDRLADPEQVLLRRCSVFAGGWSLQGAEQVCSFRGLRRQEVLGLVTSLVSKSLVNADSAGAQTRYRMLEPVNRYATERLTEAGEETMARIAHAQWCTRLVGEARTAATEEALVQMDAEYHGNIKAALRWAVERGGARLALRLAWALLPVWQERGDVNEGRKWFDALLPLTAARSELLREQATYGAAVFGVATGHLSAAAELAHDTVELARVSNDEVQIAEALNLLGFARVWNEPGSAVSILEEGVRLARHAEDGLNLSRLLSMLGLAYWACGNLPAAHRAFEECLPVSQLGGEAQARGARLGLGMVAVAEADLDRAENLLTEVLFAARDADDRRMASLALAQLAEVSRGRNRHREARDRLEEALSLARSTGAVFAVAGCLLGLGRLELAEGDLDRADSFFQEVASWERGDSKWVQAERVRGLAKVSLARGDTHRARIQLREALAMAREAQLERAAADSLFELALLRQAAGDHTGAASEHYEALRLRTANGDRAGIAKSLEAFAGLAAEAGRAAEGARLLAAAQALWDEIGVPGWRTPAERQQLEDRVVTLSEQLGDAFADAWDQGRAMSPRRAVAYACRRRGPRRRGVTGWASLTPAEQDVAALVGKGLTNREVGERLFITAGTVRQHLMSIFAKLGIDSRRELRDVAPEDTHARPTGHGLPNGDGSA